MSRPRIVLVDNHDSYTYNLFQLLWVVSGVRPDVILNDQTSAEEVLTRGYTHAVISPGPGSPGCPDDIGMCVDLLRAIRVPCLGVCLGHQAIAYAFGGGVVPAPTIAHGLRSEICHDGWRHDGWRHDGWQRDERHGGNQMFDGIPRRFHAVRYHSLAVAEPVPDALVVTSRSDDGVVMSLEHRERPLVGVQFHPESILTEHGDRMIANFLGLGLPARVVVRSSDPVRSPDPVRTRSGGQQPRQGRPSTDRVLWREVPVAAAPATVFTGLFADRRYAFWLDSASRDYGMGRYSFMGAMEGDGWSVTRTADGGCSVTVETPHGTEGRAAALFDVLRARLARAVPAGDVPVPFVGGYVGYLGYGVKASTGLGKGGGAGAVPDAELLWVDRLLAFDHETGRAFLVTTGVDDVAARTWFADMAARLEALPMTVGSATGASDAGSAVARDLRDSVDRDTYRAHVARIQEWLAAGESYESCYTYQITGKSDADPLAVYLRLRTDNPAPYAAYLRFGDRHVLGCSPERFVTVDDQRWVETKPIKGTAPRCSDLARDAAAAVDLAAGEKTRAENLMIVDLLRNDLGRVCEPGTVGVPSLMAVESYATVHQLVSTVRGRLRQEIGAVDCLAALFPGGSMTGAPKRRTVELLDDLEPVQRGIYSGCLGYFGVDGRADHSIVIRTIVWQGDRFAIGVGGAVTAMSDPDEEYAETRLKARALLAVVGRLPAPAVSYDCPAYGIDLDDSRGNS